MGDTDSYQADLARLSAQTFDNTSRYPITNFTYSHSNINGVEHYSGQVTGVGVGSGNYHFNGAVSPIDAANGSFSVTSDQLTPPFTYSFQILGASPDGRYLVLGELGSPSSPAYVYSLSGFPYNQDGGMLNPPNFSFDTSNIYVGPACYCAGTMILTPAGERPIESLQAGDLVTTMSGVVRPIVWVGRQTIVPERDPRPDLAHPILITEGAIAPGIPNRDLLVSPGHGIAITCVEPVFVEAQALVNDATVRQMQVETVNYYHLELDTHDVIIANGLTAESYLDVGNRHHLGGVATLRPSLDPATNDHGSCHPRLADGPVVDAIQAQMQKRAKALGWQIKPKTADLTITADHRVLNVTTVRSLLRCEIEPSAKSLDLRSDTFSAITPPGDGAKDSRTFGIFVESLALSGGDGDRTVVPLDHPCFASGFWDIEHGDVAYRWTDGEARIDLTTFDLPDEVITVEIGVGLLQQAWAPPIAEGQAVTVAA